MSAQRRLIGLLLLVGGLLLTNASSVWAQCSGPNFVEQKFPVVGVEQTRWRVCWQNIFPHGLVITSAHFRKAPKAPFVRVFWDARVSEILVPYHAGAPRFYDITSILRPLLTLNLAHCPASIGSLLGSPPVVCKEVRDRGLAWSDDAQARRGQELVLWGSRDAVNYDYIFEWTFRDDGMVLGRVGATARNLPTKPLEAHSHTPIWRLDIDLDGFAGDSVHEGTHTEVAAPATDSAPLIANETDVEWKPLAHTTLHVHDASLKNAQGQPSMYHLMPLRTGTARHHGPGEGFTRNDFWVTRYKSTEMQAKNLLTYISPPEKIANTDIVVWYQGALHHLVRSEDGRLEGGFWRGVAHVMWTGWMLKPHNLFDTTPLWP